ncbi:tRNA methyltransferase [Tylopilus felleus]
MKQEQEYGRSLLNPVQEFNRYVSVACIRVWSEEMDREKEDKFRRAEERRVKRLEQGYTAQGEGKTSSSTDSVGDTSTSARSFQNRAWYRVSLDYSPKYHTHKFVLLEALSATGLRSIRYAKEIPLARFVIANDLSPSVTAAMKRNVEINGLGPTEEEITTPEGRRMIKSNPGKVRVHEDDACALMYNHRTRVDVVDLDPYGTAAPFIDAAVPSRLLCVTCTDMSVLATTNYSEKCFSNYGGMPIKSEYSHEAASAILALRLVLNTISTFAIRYGRYIEPLLSLSIDFYIRIFVRIHAAPIEVKKHPGNTLAFLTPPICSTDTADESKTSIYYVCSGCTSFHEQKLGRVVERTNKKSGAVNLQYKTATGPPVNSACPECGYSMHFVAKVVEHVDRNSQNYGTSTRMMGMLTVAQEELDVPFYFTLGKMAGTFHCSTPALGEVASALLNAGYRVSRSHASPGLLKTTAPRDVIHDVFRAWAERHPVRTDRISETAPAAKLLSKAIQYVVLFSLRFPYITHPFSLRLVFNPLPNWGPGGSKNVVPNGARR